MPFKFRLKKVLDYRLNLETMAREELGRQEALLQLEIDRLIQLRRQEEETLRFARQLSRRQDFSLQAYTGHYLDKLDHLQDVQRKAIQEARGRVVQARRHLKKCWREKKVLETLQEQQARSFEDEMKRVERTFNDEVALLAFYRRVSQAEE